MFSSLALFSGGPSSILAGKTQEGEQAIAPDASNQQQQFDTGSLPEDILEPSSDSQSVPPNFTFSGTIQIRATMDTRDDDRQENNTSLRNRIFLESRYKKMPGFLFYPITCTLG